MPAAVNQILYPGHLYARACAPPHQYSTSSPPHQLRTAHAPRARPISARLQRPRRPWGRFRSAASAPPLPRSPPEPHQLPRDFRRPVAVLAWLGLGLGLGLGFRLGIGLGLGFGLGFGLGSGSGQGLGLGFGLGAVLAGTGVGVAVSTAAAPRLRPRPIASAGFFSPG